MGVLLWLATMLCPSEGWVRFMAQRLGILAGACSGSSDPVAYTVQTLLLSAQPFFAGH
jgi:hypothetical protein